MRKQRPLCVEICCQQFCSPKLAGGVRESLCNGAHKKDNF
jgi:hypothetical protein